MATEKSDDVKAKFKEALDRKNAKRSRSETDAENADGTRIHGTHESAATQRQFRRKSG